MDGDHSTLKRFIRHTLGCGCPDEVLDKIAIDRLSPTPPGGRPILRIDVGGRLLIYLVDRLLSDAALGDLLLSGVADRNEHGFNRLRVVLCRDSNTSDNHGPDSTLPWPNDDKVHVHRLPRDQIPLQDPHPA